MKITNFYTGGNPPLSKRDLINALEALNIPDETKVCWESRLNCDEYGTACFISQAKITHAKSDRKLKRDHIGVEVIILR